MTTWAPGRLSAALRTRPLPGVLTAVAGAALLLTALDMQSPVRTVVVLGFLLVVPGLAVLDIWDLAASWLGATLGVALSIALATLVTTWQLFTRTWSTDGALIVLVAVTVVAAVASTLAHRARGRHRGRS